MLAGVAAADVARMEALVLATLAHSAPPDDPTAMVLGELLARRPLYATAAARHRWEMAARTNIDRELRSLSDNPE